MLSNSRQESELAFSKNVEFDSTLDLRTQRIKKRRFILKGGSDIVPAPWLVPRGEAGPVRAAERRPQRYSGSTELSYLPSLLELSYAAEQGNFPPTSKDFYLFLQKTFSGFQTCCCVHTSEGEEASLRIKTPPQVAVGSRAEER